MLGTVLISSVTPNYTVSKDESAYVATETGREGTYTGGDGSEVVIDEWMEDQDHHDGEETEATARNTDVTEGGELEVLTGDCGVEKSREGTKIVRMKYGRGAWSVRSGRSEVEG